MTTRARWYLTIAATRHLLLAAAVFLLPNVFAARSFYPILQVAPLWAWGLVFFVAGSLCAHGALFRSPHIARLGLMWSATSTAVVAVGLLLGVWSGETLAPVPLIVWASLAAKDFTVCADPLRSPFEEWAQQLVDEDAARSDDRGTH